MCCGGFFPLATKPLDQLNLEHLIKNTVNDQLIYKLATLAIEQMRTRTRLGYGVPDLGAAQQKLAPLQDSTVANRKRAKAKGTLAGQTTPKKSNLTHTGQLLDSIKFIARGNTIEISIMGERNRSVATFVTEQGRPFFTLSKSEVSRLVDVIQQAIDTYLKKGS